MRIGMTGTTGNLCKGELGMVQCKDCHHHVTHSMFCQIEVGKEIVKGNQYPVYGLRSELNANLDCKYFRKATWLRKYIFKPSVTCGD